MFQIYLKAFALLMLLNNNFQTKIRMEKKKILYISQEIMPYLPETEMSHIGRYLPQGIQEKGKEIRAFMPRFGSINERRNQLHEVIRLSGMNLIIDDLDHSLIIKVASIQTARMQVYFIDNEDYFHRKHTLADADGKYFDDNDERMIFFGRGVLETVKKLRWSPDIIHCHGWMASLVPLYLKKAYIDDPLFAESKVIYSSYDDAFDNTFADSFQEKLKIEKISDEDISALEKNDYFHLQKLALQYSDAVIMGNEKVDERVEALIKDAKVPVLEYQTKEEYIEAYSKFYDSLLEE